ncbi:hypothetical protein FHW04_004531 [Pantoea sp. AN62]
MHRDNQSVILTALGKKLLRSTAELLLMATIKLTYSAGLQSAVSEKWTFRSY